MKMVSWWTRAAAFAVALAACGCSALRSTTLPVGNPGHEVRAAWILNFQDEVRNEQEARDTVMEARTQQLNTLYVVAFHQGYAFYPSQVAPLYVPPGSYRPLDFDPLQVMIDEAHRKGARRLQVYAWVSFCQAWESRDMVPAAHPVVRHPDWLTAPYDATRAVDVIPQFWFDPGVPAVLQYSGEICRELANRYDIDGLLLDSVEYRPGGYGYNPIALQRFAQEMGRADRPEPDDPVWQTWKARQVTNLVERMSLMAHSQRPGLPVAVVAGAEGPMTPRFEQSQPYTESGQNWPLWLRSQAFDCLVLRNFKRQASREEAREFSNWLEYAKIQANGRAVVCGIAAKDNALLATRDLVQQVRQVGVQGMAFWRMRDNNSEGRPQKALFELLRRTHFSSRAKPPEFPWLTHPTTGILMGQVRTPTAMPVGNVQVSFPELGREAYTHPDGTFVLFAVPARTPTTPKAFWNGTLYPAESSTQVERGQLASTAIILLPRP